MKSLNFPALQGPEGAYLIEAVSLHLYNRSKTCNTFVELLDIQYFQTMTMHFRRNPSCEMCYACASWRSDVSDKLSLHNLTSA